MFELLLYVLMDSLIRDVHLLLQLEDGAVDLFSNSIKEDGLLVDMEAPKKPRVLSVYIQGWHNQIWEHAFMGFFKGKDSYTRSKAFEDQRQTDLAVKRVVFR